MSHTYIHHYTSIDSLLSVIKGNTLRFTNSLYLNDPVEHQRVVESEVGFDYFVFCASKNEIEQIPLWLIYSGIGKDKDIRKGVRLSINIAEDVFTENAHYYYNDKVFLKKDSPIYWLCPDYYEGKKYYGDHFPYKYTTTPRLECVSYDDNELCEKKIVTFEGEPGQAENKITTDTVALCTIKGTAWAYEEEIRFYSCAVRNFRPKKIDALYFELNDTFYDKLIITINPFADFKEKEVMINKIISSSNGRLLHSNFKDSTLIGKVNF